jgi:pyrroline-5-carboxylate reductase
MTMMGSAKLALESGKHFEQLKDEVCSPAGSTIEGVEALEKGGVRAAMMDAVRKSCEKNKALGKTK